MLNTIEYLEGLPIYETTEELAMPWLELSSQAISINYEDFGTKLKEAQACVDHRLLPNIQFDEQLWAKPSHMIGSLLVYPDDDYRRRTNQTPLAKLREYRSPGRYIMGLELELELIRRYPAPRFGSDMYFPSAVYSKLSLNHGREMDAFRDIYDDYRGIVGKLLEMGHIQFSMSSVIAEVEAVRSKKPLPKLDVVLHLKEPNPDEHWFDLEYIWYPHCTYSEGLTAFLVQAILFTCIQKASVSPRARRDLILDIWNCLAVKRKV